MAWAWGQPLAPTPRMVLMALADRLNKETLRCDPSAERIAKDTMLSTRAVEKFLPKLQEWGLITIVGRPGRPSQYVLHLDHTVPAKEPPSDADDAVEQTGHLDTPAHRADPTPAQYADVERLSGVSGGTSAHYADLSQATSARSAAPPPHDVRNTPELRADEPWNLTKEVEPKEESKIPPKSPTNGIVPTKLQLELISPGMPSEVEIAEAFKAFWKAYPSTNGKAEAERNFRLAAIGKLPPLGSRSTTGHTPVPLQDMINGAIGYAEEIDRSPKDRSIKHAQGWLTERRWRDYEDGKVSGPRPKESLHGRALVRRAAEERSSRLLLGEEEDASDPDEPTLMSNRGH